MTVTVFINLIPPSQAHQQSSRHILIYEKTQKHSEIYLLEKTWLLCILEVKEKRSIYFYNLV